MGGRGGCTQPRAAGLGGVLLLWDASDGVPGGGSVCRNAGAALLAATTPGSDARDAALLVRRDLRRVRSEEHTSELQSQPNLVCRLLLEKTTSPAAQTCPHSPLSTAPTRTRNATPS